MNLGNPSKWHRLIKEVLIDDLTEMVIPLRKNPSSNTSPLIERSEIQKMTIKCFRIDQ